MMTNTSRLLPLLPLVGALAGCGDDSVNPTHVEAGTSTLDGSVDGAKDAHADAHAEGGPADAARDGGSEN